MNVVFVAPDFPPTQRHFVRALAEVGRHRDRRSGSPGRTASTSSCAAGCRTTTGSASVTDERELTDAVRWAQGRLWVDRLETTIESHTLPVAHVREACGIPGTSSRTAWLCRDKPSMKEALRAVGVPTAASTAAVTGPTRCTPSPTPSATRSSSSRAARAGALDTVRVDSRAQLDAGAADLRRRRLDRGGGVRRGPRGLLRHAVGRRRSPRSTSSRHYYPNVLEAMRERWISPQFVSTNRVDDVADYQQLREMGARVNEALGHRHQRDAHGVVLRAEGAALLRDRLPSAGRRRVGPLLGRQRPRRLPRVGQRGRARRGRRPPVAAARHRHRRAAPGPGRRGHLGRGRRRGAGPARRVGDRRAPAARRAPPRSRSPPATWPTPGSGCATPTTTSCAGCSTTSAVRSTSTPR